MWRRTPRLLPCTRERGNKSKERADSVGQSHRSRYDQRRDWAMTRLEGCKYFSFDPRSASAPLRRTLGPPKFSTLYTLWSYALIYPVTVQIRDQCTWFKPGLQLVSVADPTHATSSFVGPPLSFREREGNYAMIRNLYSAYISHL